MANQMIALQTRGPKLADPAAQTAKFVSMMNMTRQQEAAERQAALAQQQMGINLAREDRDKETQTATMRDKDSEFQDKELKRLGRVGVAVLRTEDPTLREAAYQTLLGEVEKADPRLGATMRQVAPTFNAAIVESAVMEVDKYFNAKYPNATYSNEIADTGGFDAQGRPIPAGTLLQVRNSVVPEVAPIPSATAARTSTPVPPAAPRQTTPGPIPVGKYGEDRVIPDSAVPLTDFEQEDIRRIKEGSGMANTPASFTRGGMSTPTAGQMSPDMVPAIIDSAVKTGVMAQIDLDQMLALAPPQARQGIMDVIRSNNIALQADAPSLAASAMGQQPMAPNPVQRPQSQFADMRGQAPQASFADLGGQPQMQNTMAQYQPVQPRNREVSPIPGIYSVPTGQVAATSEAQRSSPKEEAAKAAATARATATVETEKKAAEKLPGRKQVSTLINKVRAAYEALDKAEAIPSETRGGFANAMDYFGTSSLGREAQKMVGTKSSKYLSEIINSRKLLATAIKNATGMSAQEMNSNVELQLTLDALTDPTQGIEAARTTLNTLEELYGAPRTAAPAAAPRAAAKTPVIPTLTPEQVRANPKIKRWKRSDNGQIMVRQ